MIQDMGYLYDLKVTQLGKIFLNKSDVATSNLCILLTFCNFLY